MWSPISRSSGKHEAKFPFTHVAFPDEPLVVYLFNPFGAATMQVVLDHLATSLQRCPRHVVVVLLWPRCGEQVARIPGMRRVCATRKHEIYEALATSA